MATLNCLGTSSWRPRFRDYFLPKKTPSRSYVPKKLRRVPCEEVIGETLAIHVISDLQTCCFSHNDSMCEYRSYTYICIPFRVSLWFFPADYQQIRCSEIGVEVRFLSIQTKKNLVPVHRIYFYFLFVIPFSFLFFRIVLFSTFSCTSNATEPALSVYRGCNNKVLIRPVHLTPVVPPSLQTIHPTLLRFSKKSQRKRSLLVLSAPAWAPASTDSSKHIFVSTRFSSLANFMKPVVQHAFQSISPRAFFQERQK